MSRFNPKLGAFINDDEPEIIIPSTRECDEELIKSQIKEIVLKLAETVRGEE